MSELRNDIIFEFLSDDPEGEDGFSGKGHERSARALANAIIKFSEYDRSIGLEGAWGSGKTTVVRIAEQELERSHQQKFAFCTFDLWANQSVEFRRAFLEEFLGWSKSYLSQKAHENLERRVQGKTKIVETESERQFSIFGYILMSALFLMPFLVLWLSPFSANLHRDSGGQDGTGAAGADLPWLFQIFHDYGHWAAVVLVVIVFLGFLVQSGYLWWTKGSLRKALDGSFSLFARKSDKDTVTQTIRDGDPTQYEFHEIFTDILLHVQGSDRRVIFVFDNIDRLPADLIQESWSNVRSIFSRDSCREKSPNEVVTAVVPYDRAHVLSAFEDSGVKRPAPADEGDSDFRPVYVLEDVFRKTFNAVVTVALPVTSNVETFFNQCLEKALPDQFSIGQKYRLFQIFDTFLTDGATNPTPRQVKSFVNDVGMLWFQWQGAITIEAIAIFVLHRSKLEAEPRLLQNPDTIHSRYRHFAVTENLDGELAALAYNVEPNIALEVLLERDITAALRNPKGERLMELASSPGFKHQLDRILNHQCTNWASSSLNDFEAALTNYSQLSLDNSIKVLCNKHFTSAIPKLGEFDITTWESHKPLFQIVACMPKDSLARHMKEIVEWVDKGLPEERTEELGRTWVKFIGGFVQEAIKIHGGDVTASVAAEISVPYSPEFYIGVALDCDEIDLHFSQFGNIATQKSSEISAALTDFGLKTPQYFYYVWYELQYALKGAEKASVFAKLMEYAQNNLLDNEGKRQTYLENLVLVAAEVQGEKNVVANIKAAIVDGTLPWHAAKSNEAEDWQSIANSVWLAHIALGTEKAPGLAAANKSPFGDVNAAHVWFGKCYAGKMPGDTLKCMANLVIKYDKVDGWLSAFAESLQQQMYRDVLSAVFAAENCPALELETFIKYYTILQKNFSDQAVEAMVKRVGTVTPNEQIKQLELSTIPPSLVRDVAGLQEEAWALLLARIDQHLKTITAADWEEALLNNNHNRELLFMRGNQLNGVIPPNHLRVPLADFVSKIMVQNTAHDEGFENHSAFWSALSPDSRKGVSKDIFERIADRPVSPEGLQIAMSAFPGLFANLPLEDRPETTVSKILIPLLSSGLEKTLAYINTKPSVWATCVEKVTPEIRSQLNDYFLGFEDAEVQNQLDELRKILKLPKPKKKQRVEETEKLDKVLDADAAE